MRPPVLSCAAAVLLALATGPLACKTERPTLPSATSPVFQVTQACVDCHKGHVEQWQDGGHNQVSCETCHWSGVAHATAATRPAEPRPKMRPTDGSRACLGCHRQLKSFEEHLKAVEAKHVMKANVERAQGKCVYCHDPHSLQ